MATIQQTLQEFRTSIAALQTQVAALTTQNASLQEQLAAFQNDAVVIDTTYSVLRSFDDNRLIRLTPG